MSDTDLPSRPEAVVRVRGEARLEVDPEIARFAVHVSAQDKDRRRTLERLTERADALRRQLGEYDTAIEEVETGAASVAPVLREGRGERVRTYQGTVRVRATANDFEALGTLMVRLADADMTAVHGPHWELRPESPVYQRARQQATREALDRARVYAEALDSRITGLVELADVGLSSDRQLTAGPPQPGAAYDAALAQAPMGRGAGGGEPKLDLDPARITVNAQLEATFTMAAPPALG